jgi:LDH2 family malate/lactate/ureidoglycolate dehydrogenase
MRATRVPAHVIKELVEDLLDFHGVEGEEAAAVVDHILWCELAGRANFGMERLPILLKRKGLGLIKSPCCPRFEPVSPSMAKLDGSSGFGQYVGGLAMHRAIELAHETGCGIIGVRNSNHFGAGAVYVKQAADAGKIGLALSNSYPKVAPHGGLKAVLGTNPFAFGAPRKNGEHLLIDMATSALAGSTVREHLSMGRQLAPGLAIDANGQPVTDPAKINDGALLPFGGAKGFGLALMVEVLAGVLTGAGVAGGVGSLYQDFDRTAENGHLFIAIDVRRWMCPDAYHERLEALIGEIRSAGGNVRLPGELRWHTYRENLALGIPVDPVMAGPVLRLADESGIPLPLALAA